MNNNETNPLKGEPKCTLSDSELIEKCQQWVHDLAKSGGKKWSLRVPVDFNRDPDMLFLELCKRLQSQSLPAVEQPVLSNKIGHINCDSEALKDPEFVNAVNRMTELAYHKTVPAQPEGKTLKKAKYRLGRKLNRVILTQDGTKEIAVVTFMPGCKELAEKVVKILNDEP